MEVPQDTPDTSLTAFTCVRVSYTARCDVNGAMTSAVSIKVMACICHTLSYRVIVS